MSSDEERNRRQMGSPVWPLKPGPFEWEKKPMTQSPSPSVDEVEAIIDAVMASERYAPKTVPMVANPPLFDGMQPDNDGPWVSRVDVAKRLRASLVSTPKAGAGERLDDNGLGAAEAAWRASIHPTCKGMLTEAITAYLRIAARNHEARGDGVRGTDEIANCCICGRIIDTREKSEGGDDFGAQLEDGRWTCSFECHEKAVPELAAIEAALPPLGDNVTPEAVDQLRQKADLVIDAEQWEPLGDGRAEIVEECAREIERLAVLLDQQLETLDIGREVSAYTIAAKAVRALKGGAA